MTDAAVRARAQPAAWLRDISRNSIRGAPEPGTQACTGCNPHATYRTQAGGSEAKFPRNPPVFTELCPRARCLRWCSIAGPLARCRLLCTRRQTHSVAPECFEGPAHVLAEMLPAPWPPRSSLAPRPAAAPMTSPSANARQPLARTRLNVAGDDPESSCKRDPSRAHTQSKQALMSARCAAQAKLL